MLKQPCRSSHFAAAVLHGHQALHPLCVAVARAADSRHAGWVQGPPVKLAHSFPEGRLLYDFVFDAARGKWVPWMDTTEAVPISLEAEYTSIIVPTVDTVRYTYLLDKLVTHGCHCMFVGPTGASPPSCSCSAAAMAAATLNMRATVARWWPCQPSLPCCVPVNLNQM
jgi:hypothetical protein